MSFHWSVHMDSGYKASRFCVQLLQKCSPASLTIILYIMFTAAEIKAHVLVKAAVE